MAIITDQQLGSVNYTTPKVLIVEVTPSPQARATSTNVVGAVMQLTKGDPNKIITIGSLADFTRKCGYYDSELDGYLFVDDFFKANGSVLKIARAVDDDATKSSGVINSSGDIALFTFEAKTVGTDGNQLTSQITNATVDDYFNIIIRHKITNQILEYKKVTTDSTDTRYIKTIIDNDPSSQDILTVTVHVTDGTLPENGTVDFTGGTNGTDYGDALSDTAYIGTELGSVRSGIKLFKQTSADDINIVVSARSNDNINTELILHVTDINVAPRRTIIAFEEGTDVDTAIANMATLDYDKVKVVYPHVKCTNPFTLQLETHNPTSFESANDTLLGYWQSASQTALPANVKELEYELSQVEIDQLTAKRINPYKLQIGSGFIRASDYTTSSNPELQQNVVRKAKDFFGKTFHSLYQLFLSKPITARLWNEMADSARAFLRNEAKSGNIGLTDGGTPYFVKIDNENNPPEIVKLNRVMVYIEISLLAIADTIQVMMDARQEKTIINA